MDDSRELRKVVGSELGAQILSDFGKLRFRATGSSMLPAIRPGDILVVHRRKVSETQSGDVAFFAAYGGVVAHRIISRNGDCLTTQGDSIASPDPAVTANDFLGLVTSVERDGASFAPSRNPGAFARLTAAILKRSDFAMRMWLAVWLRFSNLHGRSKPQLHNVSSRLTASS